MDCEALIVEVRNRPAIWDISDTMHHNRGHLDKLWDEIRKQVGCSKDKCRKKWKYLRDRYRSELRKEHIFLESGHGDFTEFKSTFNHFHHMLFLRPQMWLGKVEPRNFYDSHIVNEAEVAAEDEPSAGYIEYDATYDSDINQYVNNEIPFENGEQPFEENPYSTKAEYLVPIAEANNHQSTSDSCKVPKLKLRLQKKTHKKRKFTKRLLQIEERKTELLEKIESAAAASANQQHQQQQQQQQQLQSERESEDLLFFKSLLGYMESFTPVQNLRVRNKIQAVILDEIDASAASVSHYATRNRKFRL